MEKRLWKINTEKTSYQHSTLRQTCPDYSQFLLIKTVLNQAAGLITSFNLVVDSDKQDKLMILLLIYHSSVSSYSMSGELILNSYKATLKSSKTIKLFKLNSNTMIKGLLQRVSLRGNIISSHTFLIAIISERNEQWRTRVSRVRMRVRVCFRRPSAAQNKSWIMQQTFSPDGRRKRDRLILFWVAWCSRGAFIIVKQLKVIPCDRAK